ncbi:DUF5318 domain-containing protein [soil metagenome]
MELMDGTTLSQMSFTASALTGGGTFRGIIDHRLERRALINEYRRGRLRQDQVCDAHPELIRAATNVGTETTNPCPICEEQQLRLVTYVFGPRLPAHGKCVTTAREMAALNRRCDELAAYIVEACIECSWHHLLRVLPVGGR